MNKTGVEWIVADVGGNSVKADLARLQHLLFSDR